MLCYLVLVAPLMVGVITLVFPWRAWIGWAMAVSAAVVLGGGIALSIRTSSQPAIVTLHGALRADALSSFMVVVIGAVSLLAEIGRASCRERV